MHNVNDLIQHIIRLRKEKIAQITLMAVCPNSEVVLEAAIKTAAKNNCPMLFAATLNQVDRDGGYTGWTPAEFVKKLQSLAEQYSWNGPVYPCLDHGGPWLKDDQVLKELSYNDAMDEVKKSITACLEAGYMLLHIDPTVDITLPKNSFLPIDKIVSRTVDLIAYAESEIQRLGLRPISYEVGAEEVHGGLVEISSFETFLRELRDNLERHGLGHAWPCFVVAQVGTDLHTTRFDPKVALRLFKIVSPYGSLIKGHYTDWVQDPEQYPRTGMGGANLGPEFTSEEYLALKDLTIKEQTMKRSRIHFQSSDFIKILERAVVDSGRWKKWLQHEEVGLKLSDLPRRRREWLIQSSARYVWTMPIVIASRNQLYENLSNTMLDPHAYVVDRVACVMDKYIYDYHLFDSLELFTKYDGSMGS